MTMRGATKASGSSFPVMGCWINLEDFGCPALARFFRRGGLPSERRGKPGTSKDFFLASRRAILTDSSQGERT
jgi:hypothetical protein